MPPPPLAEADAANRPTEVAEAAKISLAAVVSWFLSATLGQILNSPSQIVVTSITTTTTSGRTDRHVESLPLPTPIALVLFVITAALWVALIMWMRGGRNWARTMLTILGVVGCVIEILVVMTAIHIDSIGIATNAGGVVEGLLGLLTIGLVIPALIGMNKHAAKKYFHRKLLSS